MRTEISTDRAAAVELLRKGEAVALPTETVYGLAADALNPIAVAKIFEAKERPRFDPLIVHLPDQTWLEKLVDLPAQDRQLILKLVEKFWPGPFTLVLPKREMVPDIVTAGLETVAVRLSAHPIFSEIIRAFGRPLAAPSANRFGRVSPTTAQHVLDELDGRVRMIIDAGPTAHGIESTIVAVHAGEIDILRRGPITSEQLRGMGFQPMSHRQDDDATEAGFQPMDPYKDVSIRQGAYLPHWTQTGATYAVTFRLIDALPIQVLESWKLERRSIVLTAQQQGRELTENEQERLERLYSEKIENYLDAGHGKCWLRDERLAKVVRDALLHFQGQRYELGAFCVMPNHVHVVVRPKAGHALSDILRGWKSFAAKAANRLLERTGAFWQPESYDHLIRGEEDLANQTRYIVENPGKAGLKATDRGMGLQPKKSHRQDADATGAIVRAPGQLPSHYAPNTPVRLIDDARSFSPAKDQRVGLLAWNPGGSGEKFTAIRRLSEHQDLREAAANLFRHLRELDALDLDLIVAERVPSHGLGAAIMDRLDRASAKAGS